MKKLILLVLLPLTLFSNQISANTQEDKKNVVAFYNEVVNKKDFEATLKYIGTKYIQHNPLAEDGIEGLKKYIQFLREKYPNAHSEIKRILVDQNFVVLHVHTFLEPNTRGLAIIDLFRLENGKIVEHWDVIQQIPEKSANDNGMF